MQNIINEKLLKQLYPRFKTNKEYYLKRIRSVEDGFAGTVQAFVPKPMVKEFTEKIENILGGGSRHVLSIRSVGGTEIV